ncbi:MAG: DUF1127 domain-containing protein [Pseudomonadota bacterium]
MAHSLAVSTTFLHPVTDAFGKIWNALIRIGEANSRVRRIEVLSGLSDEQLAERGLRREDIIRHVMLDCSL